MWQIFENTHEAIIDQETYDIVQRIPAEFLAENVIFDVFFDQPFQFFRVQPALHIRDAGWNADRRILRCGD